MKKKRIVKTAVFLFLGMILYLIYSFIERDIAGGVRPHTYSFLFIKEDQYMDFFNVNQFVFDRAPYDKMSSYPPLALVIAYLSILCFDLKSYTAPPLLVRDTTLGFANYCFIFSIGTVLIFGLIKNMLKSACIKNELTKVQLNIVAIIILFSAPYVWLLDRGNYLIFALIAFFLFVLNYNKNDELAALCIAVAAAIKLYPIIFLALFIVDKKIKPLLISIGSFCILFIAPFGVFKGGIAHNLPLFVKNLFSFQSGAGPTLPANWYSVSLKTLIMLPQIGFSRFPSYPEVLHGKVMETQSIIQNTNNIYYFITFVIVILTSVALIKEKTTWKKMLLITIFMVLIPYRSYDYNLVYLLPILILFWGEDGKEKFENIYILFFGLTLIPKAYYYFNDSLIGIQCLLDPFILLCFLFFCFWDIINKNKKNAKIGNVKRS